MIRVLSATSTRLHRDPHSLHDGWGLGADFQSGCFRDIGSELGGEFLHVVSEERGLVACAGDGDVAEARVEEVRVNAGIGMNEDAFGGEALGAVAGDGVPVVEMSMLTGVELDRPVVVEAGGEMGIGMDRLDNGQIAIGNAERFVGGGELDAVAYGELAVDFAIDANTGETAGIVGGKFLV